MPSLLSPLRSLALPVTVLAALSQGCVAEKCETADGKEATCISVPDRFEAPTLEQTLTGDYEPGSDLRIKGVYGDINVRAGTAGEVSLRVRPFAYGTHDSKDEAFEKMRDKLYAEIANDGNAVAITTWRDDTKLPLVGADLDIYLPPEFDGGLVVENQGNGTWNPGNIKVFEAAEARSVEVRATSLSDCQLQLGPTVTYTAVRCDGDIRVVGASDDVSLETQGQLGNIEVQLVNIEPTSSGGRFKAGSDIRVIFPSGDDFSVQATGGKLVDFGGLPAASCSVEAAAENSKSATCGDGGPLYEITSLDGTVKASF
ncbi:MAG TPA: hypothetical protein VFQ61_08845 [Polyangiaceae bacterium]|nr:hypothetical protein [Polyangiaceae bacterium]